VKTNSETALEALKSARIELEKSSVESPRRTAEVMLSELLGVKPHELYLREDLVLGEFLLERYSGMVEERKKGKPLAYVVGNVEFMGLRLSVPEGVFIPRPETEVLCELVLEHLREVSRPVILDICTGCGAIPLALLKVRADMKCYGTDISPEAVRAARLNARHFGLSQRAVFFEGDLARPLEPLKLEGKLDCVISNPPYVKGEEIALLQREISEHEPHGALHGGPDGLLFYPRIASDAARLLARGGLIALEVGDGRAAGVIEILESGGFREVTQEKDLSGIERFVLGWK
jgi:release factor glutamine methyltransferase